MTDEISDLTELELVQNPGFGAYLIWNFTLGYQEDGAEAAPFLLAFLVLPILFHRRSMEAVASTRKASGLTLFAAKFDREREALIALQTRALLLRPLTLQSIGVAATSRLVRIRHETGLLHGYPSDLLDVRMPLLPERIKALPAAANKLGYWFSRLGMSQVASTLRIEF